MEEVHQGRNVIEPNVVQPAAAPRRNTGAWIALSIVLAALIIAIGVVQAAYHKWKSGAEALPAAHPVVTGTGPSPSELSNSFRAVAKAVEPAVVNIKITETVQQGGGGIFSWPFGGGPGGRSKRAAEGSGVIVTGDGYILTNNHVVGSADKIEVTLADGKKFKGT